MLYKNNHICANRMKLLNCFGHFLFLTRYFYALNYFIVILLSTLNMERLLEFITVIYVNMITVLVVYLSYFHFFCDTYRVDKQRNSWHAGKNGTQFVIQGCWRIRTYYKFDSMWMWLNNYLFSSLIQRKPMRHKFGIVRPSVAICIYFITR